MKDPFRSKVAGIPAQLRWEPNREGKPLPEKGRVILAGMGGSGMAGEFLEVALSGAREALSIHRADLPRPLRPDDSVLVVSYSGNTREMLSVWDEAGRLGLRRAAVASGGTLLETARREKATWVEVPGGSAPRAALGYLLRGVWAAAGVEGSHWEETADGLLHLEESWVGGEKSPALLLAAAMAEGLPVLLTPEPELALVGRRWIADLAENAKTAALAWPFPEATHNRIMTLKRKQVHDLRLFALGSPWRESSRVQWKAALGVLQAEGTEPLRVETPHPEPWRQALALVYLGSWTSVLLAERLGVDASDLSIMDRIKQHLSDGKGNPT